MAPDPPGNRVLPLGFGMPPHSSEASPLLSQPKVSRVLSAHPMEVIQV